MCIQYLWLAEYGLATHTWCIGIPLEDAVAFCRMHGTRREKLFNCLCLDGCLIAISKSFCCFPKAKSTHTHTHQGSSCIWGGNCAAHSPTHTHTRNITFSILDRRAYEWQISTELRTLAPFVWPEDELEDGPRGMGNKIHTRSHKCAA